ncbi:hypothetical protein QA942_23515 [Streptomyces sp. B21-106]|uniref:hypothetical protein n=1 Tax=unclassified Streptomyces TaxID=2593676 RepID=UPI002FF41445
MPTPSEHTRLSVEARLGERARTAWPQLERLHIRHRGAFAYVEAELADGERVKLMRLRYTGAVDRSASTGPARESAPHRQVTLNHASRTDPLRPPSIP